MDSLTVVHSGTDVPVTFKVDVVSLKSKLALTELPGIVRSFEIVINGVNTMH